MILSGIGLTCLVLLNLRESMQVQEQRARDVARRDAERGARELRTALLNPSFLQRVPAQWQFELADGELVVPESVGWIDEPPVFDPEAHLDPVLRDHLRRAERADDDQAVELWDRLLADPLVKGDIAAWITMRVAWFAQRMNDSAKRDALIAAIDPSAPDEVAVSLLLLCAEAKLDAPSWARAALARLPEARAQAVLAQLSSRAQDVSASELACSEARISRSTLAAARPHVQRLAAADSSEFFSAGGALVLYQPEHTRGAIFSFEKLRGFVQSLEQTPLGDEPPLSLGGTLAPDGDGFATVHAYPIPEPGLFAGLTGLGLLSVALAMLCGGGVFFALRGARREAEAARLRTEFVTGVTHELKTPLAGIRLTADLLLDGHVTQEERKRIHLRRLAGEALRLGVLIDNVLDLGRFERGERGHHPERTDLAELVRETVALFEPIATSAKLELVQSGTQGEIFASVDRDAIRQALLNVLDNARKYGGENGRVEIALNEARGAHVISVRDFGPGVPEDERDLIFERFRRGANFRDGSIPGVGLGLYLARVLLRQHGGDLVHVAAQPTGARFELRLPTQSNEGEA